MSVATRSAIKLVGLAAVAGAAGGSAWWYQSKQTAKDRQIAEQQQQIEYLEDVADRLSLEERVARIVVTDQDRSADGTLETDLLFFDVGPDGKELPAKAFTVRGERVHVSALLIRFDEEKVKAGEQLRGRTIAFWDKIHGSAVPPEEGQMLDETGEAPRVYAGNPAARGLDKERAAFEADLWTRFWEIASDTALANEEGAKVAFGQDVFGVFSPDQVYTITLQGNGGLTLYSEPMPTILRESLKAIGQSATGDASEQ